MDYLLRISKKLKINLSILITVICFVNINGGNTMSLREKILKIVTLNDNEYFELAQETIDEIDDKLIELDRFDTIFITGPKKIDITKKDRLPVLKTIQHDGIRNWKVSEDRNLLAIAYDKATGVFYAYPARRDRKTRDYSVDDHPEEIPETISKTAYLTGCRIYYLNKALDIPWKPADYSVTFICYDWISNTINVKLTEGKNEQFGSMALPDMTLPSVDAIISTDEDPSPVMKFQLPKEGGVLPKDISVQGKFKLPLTEYNILDRKNKSDVDAVIPVYFMMVYKNLDQRSPWVFRWNILIKENGKVNKGDVAEGIFKFKLSELFGKFGNDPIETREYCCYMIANGICFGFEKILIVK